MRLTVSVPEKHRKRKSSGHCGHYEHVSTTSPTSSYGQPEAPPRNVTLQEFPAASCSSTTNSSSLDNIMFSSMDDMRSLGLDFDLGPATSSLAESGSTDTTEEVLHRLGCNKEPFLEPVSSGVGGMVASDRLGHEPDIGSLGQSPLHIAAQKGYGKIVRLLLKHDADCNRTDSTGLTPLLHATIGGHDDVVDVLLSYGAGIQYVDDQHRSPLHLAVVNRQDHILKKLLRHCASDSAVLNAYTKDGRTPLHIAVDMGFEAAVEALLDFGANVQ